MRRRYPLLARWSLSPAARRRRSRSPRGGSPSELIARVRLLTDESSHRVLAATLYAAAAAVLVLPTVFLAYPWLASLTH